jgi:hypothetical protein
MTQTVTLRMDANNLATLVDILERAEERCKALARLRHTTEVEKVVLIGEAAVCQYAYLQIQSVMVEPSGGAPDWSAAEASGKLPSEAMVTAGVLPASAPQTDVQPTPAPQAVAVPYRVKGGRTELL